MKHLGYIDDIEVFGIMAEPGDGYHDEEHMCWIIVDKYRDLMSDYLGHDFESLKNDCEIKDISGE